MKTFLVVLIATILNLVFAHQHGGQQNYEVIILGAGLSGLAAAKELYDQNIRNFTILEGKDYIGGRVQNMDFDGASIPMGAGWIHESEENHALFKLAQQYNLELYKDSYNVANIPFWNRDEKMLYPSSSVVNVVNDLSAKMDTMDTKVENRINSGGADMDLATGLRWAGWHPNTILKSLADYYMFDFENGVSPSLISATQYGYTGSGEDNIVNDTRGYMYPVIQEIQPFINKILLNYTVTRIKRNGDRDYTIYTDDNKEWTAKYVLVTFSSGVLNSDIVKFEPVLPDWKKLALALAPMCYYCKIFAQFNSKFWNDTSYFMIGSSNRGDYFHWQDVSGVFNISNVLLATLTGEQCKVNHKYSDNEVIDQMHKVLSDIYPGAVKATKILRNTFNNDPLFMGAYSYQVAGINKNDLEALDHPVQQGLWFTGEYLARDNFGYTHGAHEMGVKIAKNMIKCIKDNDCPSDKPKVETLCVNGDSRQTMASLFWILFLTFVYKIFV